MATELFNCIKQINNSIAVFDIITSILNWLVVQDYSSLNTDGQNFRKIHSIIVRI